VISLARLMDHPTMQTGSSLRTGQKKRLAKRFGCVGDAQINFASRDLAHDRLAREAGAIESGPNPAMDLGRDDDFEAGAAELGIAVQ
jgi:hypothetical protein